MDISQILRILDKNKRYKAIFLLLLRNNQHINSEKLSSEIQVSSRTIKNDIKYLKEALEKYQISIFSKAAYGYKLHIEQDELANALLSHFQISQLSNINNKFEHRVNYILRQLLSSEHYIKIEQLQEALFLSFNSSLSKELYQVRKTLEKYDLKLVSKPYYGIKIEGATFKKIMLTVRMYKYFNYKTKPNFFIPQFNQLFNHPKKEKIRLILNKTLIQSEIVLSDIYAERFLLYLIYFYHQYDRQKDYHIELPVLPFHYKKTKEYLFLTQLSENLQQEKNALLFSPEIMRFLTYILIMSNDLYRYADCSKENYNNLIKQTTEIHQFIFNEIAAILYVDISTDHTGFKDLFKLLIPITVKISLGVSDDVDLGFYNTNTIQSNPLLLKVVERLNKVFKQKYYYQFSQRENYFIFDILSGIFNRIELSKKKLKLAIISINGRLSTQQIKFNLKNYFSNEILKIDTKMLYELELNKNLDYDYYLCNSYGQNMDIPYSPIYYADDNMQENEYVSSLSSIFYHTYQYDKTLPKITPKLIPKEYKLNIFPIQNHLEQGKNYLYLDILSKKQKIGIYCNLSAKEEKFDIYHFSDSEDFTLHSEIIFMVINLNINQNTQKLKMLMNIIKQIVGHQLDLRQLCLSENPNYQFFFMPDYYNI
ncbi:BglG family transcription antiterminator [Rodentibacter heidelbergensis]|uniref:Helix-turn-helix type 11 domain-containing protein n=1 Tax=Rodentibacter heidelbergensis TaxID=1908258 RepID=A0A1V3I7S0_9PAST|nr:HTH domain-containing protein [Rodentibacter heidelbergensis]OOF36119.1 hypothetical protein BKK48_06710 [Rodentibacter heidelbergensis]